MRTLALWLCLTPAGAAALLAQQPLRVVLDQAEFRFGDSPRSDAEEFGKIGEGLLLPNGAAIILDRGKLRVAYVTPRRPRVVIAGRPGDGPGEVRDPTHILRLDSTQVALVDNGLLRLTRYRAESEDLQRGRIHRVAVQPDAMCSFGAELVGLYYDALTSSILHRMSPAGEVKGSFGSVLVQGSHRLNGSITQGRLLCASAHDMVILAAMTGTIRGYRRSGALMWERRLAEFFPVEVKEVGGGGVRFRYYPPPANKGHAVVGLTQLDAGHFLIQLGLMTLATRGTFASIESRILNIQTGDEVARQGDLPLILDVLGSRVLASGEEPEPWIEARAFRLVTPPTRGNRPGQHLELTAAR